MDKRTQYVNPPVVPLAREAWAVVPNYDGNYLISTLGRVYSNRRPRCPGRLLTVYLGGNGYPEVRLSRFNQTRHHRVHRLMAETFLGASNLVVRHLDGDIYNCTLENLCYGTHQENAADKRRHGTDHNVNKTHCPSGHKYNEANTRWYRGHRYCRACQARHVLNNRLKSAPGWDEGWAL